MSGEYITFEQPLNERIRAFLRLEHMFMQADYHLNSNNEWDARACIAVIIQIFNLLERTDLRAEVVKEIARHTDSLERLAKTPSVNRSALQTVLDELDLATEALQANPGRFIQSIRDNEFLANVRQRIGVPGGSCNFDIPGLHSWQALPARQRQENLKAWLAPLQQLKRALSLILHLTRESTIPTRETAYSGNFQKSLPVNNPCQMIRVELKACLALYPEISADKHRVNLRFMKADYNGSRALPSNNDVDFELTCCAI